MKNIRQLLTTLYDTKVKLRDAEVLRSERFTGELGEWLTETAYGGRRADTTSQKGWDIEVTSAAVPQLLQVKTHAKGEHNKARWTEIKPDSLPLFDRLIIIVLTDKYYIKEWYDIPKEDLRKLLGQSGKSWVVNWDNAEKYKQDIGTLPNADRIKDFNKEPE